MKRFNLKMLLSVAVLTLFCCVAAVAQPQQRPGGGAQRGGMKSSDPIEVAEKQTEMMAKQLGLSESQKKSLYEINLKSAEAKKSKMEESKAARVAEEKRRKEQMVMREEYNTAVMKLLNDKQKIGYAEMMQKMGGQRGGAKRDLASGAPQGGAPMKPGAAPQGRRPMKPAVAPQGTPQMAQKGGKMGAAGAPKRGDMESAEPVEMAQKIVDKMSEQLELSSSQQKKILTLTVVQTTAMKDEMEVRKLEQKARETERTEVKAQREKYNLDVMAILNEEQKIEYAQMLTKMGSQQGGKAMMQQGGKRGGNAPQQPQQGKRPAAR